MPDMTRYLGGSDVGFSIPGLGVFIGQNLTPDKETGIGAWSGDQIIAALRTGKRPDGSELSGVMPYAAFAHLTDETRRRSPPSSRAFRREEQGRRADQVVGQGRRLRLRRAAARRLQCFARGAEVKGFARP